MKVNNTRDIWMGMKVNNMKVNNTRDIGYESK